MKKQTKSRRIIFDKKGPVLNNKYAFRSLAIVGADHQTSIRAAQKTAMIFEKEVQDVRKPFQFNAVHREETK